MKHITLTVMTTALVALALGGCADESPEKRIASARQFLQKNDTRSAVIEIKNALQKNPELGEARYLLGSTLLKDGNAVGAEVELRKALAANHPAPIVVPELARSMLQLGQAKKLIDEFAGARLGEARADADLQTALAAAYAVMDKPEQAQAALNAALAADAGYAPALLLSARQKAAARDFAGALAITEDILGREHSNAEAWKLRGDLLLAAQNKPDEALVSYRKALEAQARFLPAHVAILRLLLQRGQLDDAAKQLEQLKTFAANNPQTKYFEAQLAYQKQDFKRARELTQELLQLAPNNAQVLQLAGAVELRAGAAAQAEIYLSKAVQQAPQLALARRLLITSYLRSGQSAKALAALTAAAGNDGIRPDLYALAGEVYLQNGDARRAEEYFAKALKIAPDNARTRTALAISHLASGKTDSAFEELQSIAASDTGDTADLALISAHLRRQEFDKALAAIDRLEAKQRDKPLAANLRGRVQLVQKDRAAARKSFERALGIDPDYFAAAASLASMDMADKDPAAARKRFEALLTRNPKNGQALLALAQLAAANDEGKEQIAALLTKAIEANPTDVTPRLMLIELLLRNKDHKQALASAQVAVSALPNSPELLAALGWTQQVSGDVNQAISTYNKLIAMQPLLPQPHIRLAEAQIADKDYPGARLSLRKALEIKPDLLEAQRGLIILDIQAKKYADAMKIARTVQEQRPKSFEGYDFEGDIASAQKDWPAAAAAYRTALKHSASPTAATKLHSTLAVSGKRAEADAFAARWLKEHPKDAVFIGYQGDRALVLKDYATAAVHFQSVLQLQPDSANALNNLAWIKGHLGGDGALELAEKANRLVPKQPAYMDTLAMLLADKQEFARAIDLQTQALALLPQNAALRLNLAKIYIKSGDKARAKAELESLTALGDKFSAQAEVNALLGTL